MAIELRALTVGAALFCSAIFGTLPTAPASPAAASAHLDYALGPGDEVRIVVYGEEDLGVEQQRVSAQGDIVLPLIGEVDASGLTTVQLANAIEERLRAGYLIKPRVSVSAVAYRPFYVVGEVARPGPYPFTANLNISGAVATAGGFTRNSARREIFLRREGEQAEVSYPLNAALNVQPGDTIRVGESALSTIRDLPLGLIGLIP